MVKKEMREMNKKRNTILLITEREVAKSSRERLGTFNYSYGTKKESPSLFVLLPKHNSKVDQEEGRNYFWKSNAKFVCYQNGNSKNASSK